MKIFIVIPGLNEAKYLETVIKDVLAISKNIIYVDDGSTDQSLVTTKKYLKHTLRHEINLGKGAALKTGCEYAFKVLNADAVIFMDADGQHHAQDLNKFFTELESGTQVVFGVRNFSSTMPLIRYLGNKTASIILNLLFHRYIPDIPSGYKALTKKVYNLIKWKSTGYEVEMEIAANVAKHRLPYSIVNIDTIYHDTDKGMTILDAFKILNFVIQLKIGL